MNASLKTCRQMWYVSARILLGLVTVALLCGMAHPAFGPAESQDDSDPNQEAIATGMKLQWRNGSGAFVDVPVQGLYVQRGISVTFKAVPTPQGSTFPDGPPTWSGTSGISGTGETASVTFTGSSSSMSDTFSVIATSGTLSAGTGVVSWQDSSSIQLTLEQSDSAAFYATVTYKFWTPDYSGSGQPSSSGGNAKLYLTPSFDGFDGSAPPDLQYFTQWAYSNGVAQTQTYTIQTGIHNSPTTPPDAGPSAEARLFRTPGNSWQQYYPLLRDLRAGSEMEILADQTGGTGTVGAVVKQPSANGAAPTIAQTVSMNYVTNGVHCSPATVQDTDQMGSTDISLTLTTSASCGSLTNRWDLWRVNPASSAAITCDPATITILGNSYPVTTVGFVWTADAAVSGVQGWSTGASKTVSASFNGRSAAISSAEGQTYGAGIWTDFVTCKIAKQINGGGVCSWWFPDRASNANLDGSASIAWH